MTDLAPAASAALDVQAARPPAVAQRPVAAIVLAVASAVLLIGVLAESLDLVGRSFPGFLVWDNGALVAFHASGWTGPAAALPLNGGVVVEVDGAPFAGGRALLAHAAERPVGETIQYAIATGTDRRIFAVPTMILSRGDFAKTFGNYLVAAAAFFAIGVIALWLRPDLRAARALALVTTAMGLLLALSVDYLTAYRFVAVTRFAEALAPAALAYFALVFPSERLRPRVRRSVIGALVVVLAAAASISSWLFYARPQAADEISLGFYVGMAAIGLAMMVSFGEAVMRARDPAQRMQAAVVLSGSVVAVLVPAIGVLAFSLLGWSFSWTWIGGFFLFFPASVLYAIVRHDLLGAERFVRLTLGYAIATSAVVLGYAASAFVVERLVHPGATGNPGVTFALLVAIAVSFDPLRRRVQVGIDRAFFRSRLDVARVLEEASAELATSTDEAAIRASVTERLRAALELEWAELHLEGTLGGERTDVALSEAVRFRDTEIGRVACGPKRSGAPFSASERELVRGIAAQTALALQNARALEALREAQAALLRSARLAAVGEFAGSVAHGIRNPLAGIRAAAQLAHRQAGEGPLEEALAGVLSEADRLDQRIRSLLDFSRPQTPRPERIDLGELARTVAVTLEPHARAMGVEVVVEAPPERVGCDCDPALLEEVLLELAGNALRSMSLRGGSLRLAARREGRRAVIDVSDTGNGIPPGVLDRVFDLFFTTRPDGTGMGLAMVKKIVESHGGETTVVRSDATGTTFRVALPAA